MKNNKPVIAVSIGDPNGIGSEIIFKTLQRRDVQRLGTFLIFCPGKLWYFYKKHFDINFHTNQIQKIEDVVADKINIVDFPEDNFFIEFGKDTKEAGNIAFQSLQKATNAVKNNVADILVTAPINKANIQSEDFKFSGHTEYLENIWGGKNLMFMVHQNLKVGLVTQHIPLEKVSSTINSDLIIQKVKNMHQSLQNDYSITNPTIAVLGLNPHSGDQGLIGKEEIDTIVPTIQKLLKDKITVYGPFPADSFFSLDNIKKFDGILAMYHDQGLIPFKTIAGIEGVNFTAGLPFVRTSPDHGVGYDIAGKNIADPQSLVEAVHTGVQIWENRKQNSELKKNALPIKHEHKNHKHSEK